jgi:hypothetical protein
MGVDLLKNLLLTSILSIFLGNPLWAQQPDIGSDPNDNIGREKNDQLSIMQQAYGAFVYYPAPLVYSANSEQDSPFTPSRKPRQRDHDSGGSSNDSAQ